MSLQIRANQQKKVLNRFSVYVVQKDSADDKFSARTKSGLEITARGTVADILTKVVNVNRTYFLSGEFHSSDGVVEFPLYGELSRFKPNGTLIEKVVDVGYLLQMQNNRTVATSFTMKDERYYLKASVVETTQEPEKNLYEACKQDGCSGARVIPMARNGEMSFFCPKCGTDSAEFDIRLMPKMYLTDPSKSTDSAAETLKVTAFKRNAEQIIGEEERNVPGYLQSGQIYFGNLFNNGNGKTVILRLRPSLFKGSITFSVDELF